MLQERPTFSDNALYKKSAKSTEKVNPSTKINLSLMDEKLSILNSDIEELYKKYMEKKRLRRRKEKSEQSLVSRINFLIDEERKIRSLIENRNIRNEFLSKNKSVKSIKVPEIFSNSGIMKYNTIESSEDSTLNRNNKFSNTTKENRVIKYINNSNKKSKNNKITYNSKKILDDKKNGMNEITLSSIQNNSIEANSNNIALGSNTNITNNVCIIINNQEKNEEKNNTINRDINLNNISFSKMENIYEDNKGDNYIKNDDNNSAIDNTNISQNYNENIIRSYNPFINNSNENDNKNKINNEINYIKKTLASKLKEENIQLYQEKENINVNINNQNEFGTIEKNKDKNTNENCNPYADMDDKINTPSFKIKLEGESKEKRNKSMRNILNCKIKKFKNLEKEIEQKKSDIEKKKNKVELKKKSNLIFNSDNNNDQQNKKKNKTFKNWGKKCYSKPVNTFGVKSMKTFNHNNLNKTLNKNKSLKDYSIIKKEDKKIKAIDLTNLSIDSDEIILSDANMNTFMAPKKDTKKTKDKPITIIYHKKNLNREQPNEEKIFYEYDSTPNLLNNINLTFNQSIEKKRQLLGLPINVKRNNNLKSKKNGKNKLKDYIISKKENNNNNNIKKDKSLRVIYNKRKINQDLKNKNIQGKEKKNDNINSGKKEIDYDNESYPYSNYNKFDSNSAETSSNLFRTNLNNIYKNKDKTANIPASNSLASIFSTKTNKTSRTNRTLYKNSDNNYINKSNSNLSNFNKFKKCIHSNGSNIYITRHENKNFLSTIRLVKKREKNINKINLIEEGEKKEEIIAKNINKVIINNSINKQEKNEKEKDKEKEKEKVKEKANQSKELAAIRRINQIKEEYKNKGNQITSLNKKFKNKRNVDLNISNGNSNNKKNPYKFQTYRRLSEIQKSPRYSFNNNNRSISIGKSKSNKSLLKGNRSFGSFKY